VAATGIVLGEVVEVRADEFLQSGAIVSLDGQAQFAPLANPAIEESLAQRIEPRVHKAGTFHVTVDAVA
tara:strand:+ start:12319 stop:12525 length:207 start_codon:yes stop_codon:yes gene_type:complete